MAEIGLPPPTTAAKVKGLLTHRWTRVVTYGIAVTFTSCLYAGWQQYSLLLLKGGKYDWKCQPGEVAINDDGVPFCAAQERAIAEMFPFAAAFELLGAIFAGFALDHCGPRFTAILGEILGAIAILLIMFSNGIHHYLPAAMIITGIAINMVAFPALILEDYFPSAAATTAAYVVSCQALSCIVAPVMWYLWKIFDHWTFNGIWTTYLAVIWVPAGLVYVVTLPNTREASKFQPPSPVAVSLAPDQITEEDPLRPQPPPPVNRISRKMSMVAFLQCCCSPTFLIMNLVNMILMLQTAYYQVIVRGASGARFSDFLGWSMPTQALWGLVLGRVVDFIKTPAMCIAILLMYAITYLLVLAGRSAIQYVTATIFVIAMSYAFTIKYSYIQETYPPSYYGRMVGIAGAVGGVSVLATNLLISSLSVEFWCIILALSSVVGVLMSSYLYYEAKNRATDLAEEKVKLQPHDSPVQATTDVAQPSLVIVSS